MDSRWDWSHMYVLDLPKIPIEGYITVFCLDINNVGSMSQSLYAYNNPQYDEARALGWQVARFSIISLTNFGGRILIGIVIYVVDFLIE